MEEQQVRCTVPIKPESILEEQDIAALAYALWQSRGCPDGSPEEDWFRAEEELRSK